MGEKVALGTWKGIRDQGPIATGKVTGAYQGLAWTPSTANTYYTFAPARPRIDRIAGNVNREENPKGNCARLKTNRRVRPSAKPASC